MKQSGFVSLLAAATAAAFLACAGPASAQVSNYSQDFEGLDRTSPTALSDDGWLVFAAGINGNQAFPDFGDGPFTAPNNIDNPFNSVISDFPSGGAPPAGDQGLVVLSDYGSDLHSSPDDVRDLVISVFQQQTIAPADIGKVVTFSYLVDGNSSPPTGNAITEAFLLTLNPRTGFSATNNLANNTTAIADGALLTQSLTLDLSNPDLAGQILQFGFRSTSQDFEGTAVDYDNIVFSVTNVPEPTGLVLAGLAAVGFAARRRC